MALFWHQAGFAFNLSLARGELRTKLYEQIWISLQMLPKCLGVVRKSPGAGTQGASLLLGGVRGENIELPLVWAVSVLSVGTAQQSGEGCLPARGTKRLAWQTSGLRSAEAPLDSLLLLMIRKTKQGEKISSKGTEPWRIWGKHGMHFWAVWPMASKPTSQGSPSLS